jgi:metal-sulfur cluster biosynthetic enzyme
MSSEVDPDPTPTEYCAYTEYREGEDIDALPATGEDAVGTKRDVWNALYEVQDPEMPISVVDLGLIYGVEIDGGHAAIDMTLTYTGCPARDMLRDEIRETVAAVNGIDEVDLRLVWNPEWSIEMVTEQGKKDLQEFGLSI